MERITIQFQLQQTSDRTKQKAQKIIPFDSYRNIPVSVCLQENTTFTEKITLKVLLNSDK